MSNIKAALYVRVSTLEQATGGYSIGVQKEKLTHYANSQSYQIVGVYSDEGASGKSLMRPEITRLINDIKSGKVNIVLIYKLDRLSRRVKDILELVELFEQYNVTLYSLHENIDLSSPFGRASLKMSATFSELERETIVERMQMGKAARAKSGLYSCPGKCPFGYRHNKDNDTFVADKHEKEVIIDAFNTYVQSNMSFRKLYDFFKEKYPEVSFFTNAMSLKDIIKRPLYAGYYTYKDELIKAVNVEPIISYELFLKAQEVVKKNSTKRNHDSSPYLLTGLIVCAHCGLAYVGKLYDRNRLKKDGTKTTHYKYTSYGCMARVKRDKRTTGLKCDNDIFPSQVLDDYVINAVQNLQFTEFISPVSSTGVIDSLMLENAELTKKKERLLDIYMSGLIDKDSFIKRNESIDKNLQKNYNIIDREKESISLSPTVSIEYLKDRQKNFLQLTQRQKRQFLYLIINNIVIDGQNIIINWKVK